MNPAFEDSTIAELKPDSAFIAHCFEDGFGGVDYQVYSPEFKLPRGRVRQVDER